MLIQIDNEECGRCKSNSMTIFDDGCNVVEFCNKCGSYKEYKEGIFVENYSPIFSLSYEEEYDGEFVNYREDLEVYGSFKTAKNKNLPYKLLNSIYKNQKEDRTLILSFFHKGICKEFKVLDKGNIKRNEIKRIFSLFERSENEQNRVEIHI